MGFVDWICLMRLGFVSSVGHALESALISHGVLLHYCDVPPLCEPEMWDLGATQKMQLAMKALFKGKNKMTRCSSGIYFMMVPSCLSVFLVGVVLIPHLTVNCVQTVDVLVEGTREGKLSSDTLQFWKSSIALGSAVPINNIIKCQRRGNMELRKQALLTVRFSQLYQCAERRDSAGSFAD